MRRIALSVFVLILVGLPTLGISQQAPRAHVSARLTLPGVGLYKIDFTADSMQRHDRVISFSGNVEVWLTSINGRASRVFDADEVIYNLDTPGDVEIPRFGRFTFGKKQ